MSVVKILALRAIDTVSYELALLQSTNDRALIKKKEFVGVQQLVTNEALSPHFSPCCAKQFRLNFKFDIPSDSPVDNPFLTRFS